MDPSPTPDRLPPLPADGKAVGFALAAIAFVGDLVWFGILEGMHHGPPSALMMCLATAWMTSSLGLLSVWLGLGSGPIYLRLLIAAIPGALLILFTSHGHWSIEAFAGFALFEAAVALPFGVLRLCGFKLAVVRDQPLAADSRTDADDLREGQFSLRQMFGWSVAASLVASVGRFIELPAREWFVWGVLPVAFSLVSLAIVCIALMPRERALVMLLTVPLCFATVLLVFAIISFESDGRSMAGEDAFWCAATTVGHVLLMLSGLLTFRGIDYRLARRSRKAVPRGPAVVPAQPVTVSPADAPPPT